MPKRAKPANSYQFDLGVLFVHGIGQHSQGDTLARWGEALIDWIRCVGFAPNEKTQVAVLAASLGAGQGAPAQAEVQLTIDGRQSHWFMTEAWWAKAFATPSYRQLVVWSTKIVPWAIGLHLASSLRSKPEAFGKLWHDRGGQFPVLTRGLLLIEAVFRLVFAAAALVIGLLLSPALVLFLFLLLLLGLVPIQKLRTFVHAIQQSLAGSIGDSMVLLENPIQSAAIRSRLRDTLKVLASKCRHVAVVAHSQGAAIAVETLTENVSIKKSRQRLTLITFGAGVTKLELLRYLTNAKPSGHVDAEVGLGHPWAVSLQLLAFAVLAVVIYSHVVAGTLTVIDFWPIPFLIALPVFIWPVVWLTQYFATEVVRADEHSAKRMAKYAGVASIFFLIALFIYLGPSGIIIFGLFFLIYAFFSLNDLVRYSKQTEKNVPARLRFVKHWYDFYGSDDPVPNGQIPNKQEDPSIEICNVASTLSDHIFYWKNREQFVGPIAAHLAQIAGTPFRTFGVGSEVFEAGRMRRRVRVGWLRLARWTLMVAATLYIALQWNQLRELGNSVFELIKNLFSGSAFSRLGMPDLDWPKTAAGVAVVASLALVSYGLLLAVWRLWDIYEGRAFSRGGHPFAYALFFWLPLLACVAGLPFIINETVARFASYFAGTESFVSIEALFIRIKYLALPVVIGWLLAGAVQIGWLPGRPDGQTGSAKKP